MSASGQSPQPTVLKHYLLERQLGKGAMGSVWAGQDRRDGSKVAVKLLHPHLGADPEFRARFEREAHVAALLRSPYTVHLNDYGLTEGTCYLVMEFVDGHTVADEIQRGAIDPARALRIATEIGRALEEAGARGVVHRDIKPENVLVDRDDRVKVTDFGIARQSMSAGMTTTGIFVGTPAYAAPEQADGDVDQRSDIYALGATMFAMLTGRPPYRGQTVMQILQQHKYASLPMSELGHLPDAVVNVVRRCMEKDPRDRYQTATELVGAIERASQNYAQFVRGGGVVAPPGVESARPTPSTIPIPPPTQPSPRGGPPPREDVTRIEGPPSRVAPPADPTRIEGPPSRVGAMAPQPGVPSPRAAGGGSVRAELVEKQKPGRDGIGRYTLSLANTTNALLRLRLVPTDASGVLQVNLPGRAAIPPGTTVLLDVTAQPRVRRSKGPDRMLGFGVTAVDEATGETAGQAHSEYADVVESGSNTGKFIVVAVVLVLLLAAAARVFFVMTSGGDDDVGGDDDDEETSTAGTPDDRPFIDPGEYRYNLVVTENTCEFGNAAGAPAARSFVFEAVGDADDIRDGEEVDISGIEPDGTEVFVGRAQFTRDPFVFTFPVVIGENTGQAEMTTTFGEGSTVESAQLVQVYEVGDTTCSIVAAQ